MKLHTLPLGVDFGHDRIRVALIERDAQSAVSLAAVATRAAGDDPAAALRDAVRELGTTERRCVIGIAAPDARLLRFAFPPMSASERRRAAHYEAARVAPDDGDDAVVVVSPLDAPGDWVVGSARRAALERRLRAAAAARLRVLAIDDVAFALQRVYSDADGTIDIGSRATRVTIFDDPLPFVAAIPSGGDAFTAAIAHALGIDPALAEERKRIDGFAGAGEARRDALIADVVASLAAARGATGRDPRRLVLTGNGSRVPGLPAAFARGAGLACELAELAAGTSQALPPDVLRAAGADWSVAFGLALWANAA